jgi:hypothetical protein
MVSPPKLAKKIKSNAIFKTNLFFFNWASQASNVPWPQHKIKAVGFDVLSQWLKKTKYVDGLKGSRVQGLGKRSLRYCCFLTL